MLTIQNKYPVHFDPETHTYTDKNRNRYTSVTELKDLYAPFDKEKFAQSIYNFNKHKEEVTLEWATEKAEGKQKADFGSYVHEIVSQYCQTRNFNPDENLHETHPKFWSNLLKELQKDQHANQPALCEVILADPQNLIAGTIDLITQSENQTLSIADWKTCKTLSKSGEGMMNYPFEMYPNSKYHGYIVQLSLYHHLLTVNGNLADNDMFIKHITPTGLIKTHTVKLIPETQLLFF